MTASPIQDLLDAHLRKFHEDLERACEQMLTNGKDWGILVEHKVSGARMCYTISLTDQVPWGQIQETWV